MKQMSYRGPYTPLGSCDEPIRPKFITYGFVELRDMEGQILAVLTEGSVVSIEEALGCERTYKYFSADGTVLSAYDSEDARAPFAIAQTLEQILQWSRINRLPMDKKIRVMFSELFPNAAANITITDIARLCGVTRVWATRVISGLIDTEELGRDKQCFYLMSGAKYGKSETRS